MGHFDYIALAKAIKKHNENPFGAEQFGPDQIRALVEFSEKNYPEFNTLAFLATIEPETIVTCHVNSGHGLGPHVENRNCIDPVPASEKIYQIGSLIFYGMDAAKEYAEEIFQTTGVVVGIVEVI